ncbi:Microfibrillar-associated protein 1, partial [Blyttiomyces sp. JEL0837]
MDIPTTSRGRQTTKPSKPSKPVRYWPGKAPTAADTHPSSDNSDDEDQQETNPNDDSMSTITSTTTLTTLEQNIRHQQQQQQAHTIISTQPVTSISLDPLSIQDKRLRRLMQSKSERGAGSTDDSDARARHGRAFRDGDDEMKTGAGTMVDQGDEEEDEDAMVERRRRLKELALKRREQEEREAEIAEQQQEEEGSEEEGESEEGSDDEDESEDTSDDSDEEVDNLPRRTLMKPVFVPRAHRETVLEKERLEKEAEEAEARKKQELEDRKKESLKMVEEELKRAEAEAKANDEPLDVDDTDGLNEDEEYDAWKLRELRRIKRDREERESEEKERQETERRRNMTDEELIAENALLKPEKEKGQQRFLQKYYHKGAFFVEDDNQILKRDYTAPTLEDKFDKSVLPSVMQVKNFGRAGQTKWKHLTAEDTSS